MCCLYYLRYLCLYQKWEASCPFFSISEMETGKNSDMLIWSQPDPLHLRANAAERHASSSSANILKHKAAFIYLPSHLPKKLQVKCLCDPPFQNSAASTSRSSFEVTQLRNFFHVFKPRLNCEKIHRQEPRQVGKVKLQSKLSSKIEEENTNMQKHMILKKIGVWKWQLSNKEDQPLPRKGRDWPFHTWPTKSWAAKTPLGSPGWQMYQCFGSSYLSLTSSAHLPKSNCFVILCCI